MPKIKDPKRMISLFPEFSPMRVKYKDIFDMKAFYEALHEWLQEYGWKDYEDQVGAGDHWESFYGERIVVLSPAYCTSVFNQLNWKEASVAKFILLLEYVCKTKNKYTLYIV